MPSLACMCEVIFNLKQEKSDRIRYVIKTDISAPTFMGTGCHTPTGLTGCLGCQTPPRASGPLRKRVAPEPTTTWTVGPLEDTVLATVTGKGTSVGHLHHEWIAFF